MTRSGISGLIGNSKGKLEFSSVSRLKNSLSPKMSFKRESNSMFNHLCNGQGVFQNILIVL
jgi:hypothetical protein